MRIALFFGSFNPIHIGHLALSNWVVEENYAEEVWLVVSPHNPLKEKADLLDDSKRLKWAKVAVKDYKKCRVEDIEFSMPQPSYTIDTLHRFTALYPQHSFFLLIGADNWLDFSKWKAPEEILNHYNLLVYPRRGYDISLESLPSNVDYLPAPLIEISSTFIRKVLREGKEYPFFLPKEIYLSVKKELSVAKT